MLLVALSLYHMLCSDDRLRHRVDDVVEASDSFDSSHGTHHAAKPTALLLRALYGLTHTCCILMRSEYVQHRPGQAKLSMALRMYHAVAAKRVLREYAREHRHAYLYTGAGCTV